MAHAAWKINKKYSEIFFLLFASYLVFMLLAIKFLRRVLSAVGAVVVRQGARAAGGRRLGARAGSHCCHLLDLPADAGRPQCEYTAVRRPRPLTEDGSWPWDFIFVDLSA